MATQAEARFPGTQGLPAVPLQVPLQVEGVSKSFGGVEVLREASFAVPAGTVMALLGPSGGGKTTLLRIIAGFERPDTGRVLVNGMEVAGPGVDIAPERRRLGIVPQEGALFPHLDVERNVGFGLRRAPDRRRRVAELLQLVGLPGAERRRPAELSGGQQHRVALARALAPRPAVIALDEPFSSLDAGLRQQVRDDVLGTLRATGSTAVLVTHDQAEALSSADLVAVLLDGVIAQVGPPAEIYDAPATLGVARFVGEANVLPGVLAGDGTVNCCLGRLDARVVGPDRTGACASVVVRPEQVVLSSELDAADRHDESHGVGGMSHLGLGGSIDGVVVSRAYFGHDTTVSLRLPGGELVTSRLPARTVAPAPGATVPIRVRGVARCFPGD